MKYFLEVLIFCAMCFAMGFGVSNRIDDKLIKQQAELIQDCSAEQEEAEITASKLSLTSQSLDDCTTSLEQCCQTSITYK